MAMQLTRRTFINICLLAFTLPIGSLHHFWDNDWSMTNPWLFLDYPIYTAWYVKSLSNQLESVIVRIVILRMTRMDSFFRIFAITFLVFGIMDLIFFFCFFNKNNYVFAYSCISLVVILAGIGMINKRRRQIKTD